MPTEEKLEYKVKSGSFEGPLELLLSLIESRKLFVNEITLAQVTDDYLAYMRSMGALSLHDTTGFIVVAATLILIKSKSLLPNMALTGDEEGDIVNLEDRLRLYQKIKEIGELIKKDFGSSPLFAPLERSYNEVVFTPDPQITNEKMLEAIRGVFDNLPKREVLPEIAVKKVISIEEMINNLTERMTESINTSFREFSGAHRGTKTKEEKVFVIVSFLAMLELVRQGIIDVLQSEQYGDIALNKIDENNLDNNQENIDGEISQ